MDITPTEKPHVVKIGDHVRAWDHMPMEDRPDRYVEGVVTDYESGVMGIHVLKDTVFPIGARLTIRTADFTMWGEYEERIQILGSLDTETGEYKESGNG